MFFRHEFHSDNFLLLLGARPWIVFHFYIFIKYVYHLYTIIFCNEKCGLVFVISSDCVLVHLGHNFY